MIRVALCDDEKIFLDIMRSELNEILHSQKMEFELIPFKNGKVLLHQHTATPFDVLFLDIDMPGIDGFEVAKQVRLLSRNTIVIFITAKHDLVYKSFEYQPFYFICKSNESDWYKELSHVVAKLLPYFKQNKMLEISDASIGELYVPVRSILYIQSDKHYLLYFLDKNDSVPIKEREMLSTRAIELECFDFIKPHRRYLVNMQHIHRFDLTLNSILMPNGEMIPISKNLRNDAFERFRKFMRR